MADPLKQISEHLTVMMGSAEPHFDGEDVGSYTIRTGALHKIIGLLAGAGYPVTVPLPYGLRNGNCCRHTAKCRDDRCPWASRDPAPDGGVQGTEEAQPKMRRRLTSDGKGGMHIVTEPDPDAGVTVVDGQVSAHHTPMGESKPE